MEPLSRNIYHRNIYHKLLGALPIIMGGMKKSDLLRKAGLPQTERWLFNQASELRIAPTNKQGTLANKIAD